MKLIKDQVRNMRNGDKQMENNQIHVENDLNLEGIQLKCLKSLFSSTYARSLLRNLMNEIHWERRQIFLFGKWVDEPRRVGWNADVGTAYTYSKKTLIGGGWHPLVLEIKHKIEAELYEHGLGEHRFNSCLLNLYRDGNDSMGWHSDDEPELGENPVVASVSLGAERFFDVRLKTDRKKKWRLHLSHGDVLVMMGTTQHVSQHQVPKQKRVTEPRLNLTFRCVKKLT